MESIIILNGDNKKNNNHDNLQKTHYLNYFEKNLYDIYDNIIGSFTIYSEQLEVINNINKINKKFIYHYKGTNHENIKIYDEFNENKSLNIFDKNKDFIYSRQSHNKNSKKDKNEKNKRLHILYIYKKRKIIKKVVFIDYSCLFIYEYATQNVLYSFSKKTHKYNNQMRSFLICTGGSSFSKTIFLSFGKHWFDYYLIRYIFQKINIKQQTFYLYKHQILPICYNLQQYSTFPQIEYYSDQSNNMNNLNIINNLPLSIYKLNYYDKIYYFDSYRLNNITDIFLKKETFIINNESFEFMIDIFSEIIFEIANPLIYLSIKKKGDFLHILPTNEISNNHNLSSLIIQNKEAVYFYKDDHYISNETLTKGYFFVHNDWKSVCMLDEEYIYKNKEKGTYQKIYSHTLIIQWDKWGQNIFHHYQGIYYSEELFYPIYINYQFLLFLESQKCIVNDQYQLQFQIYYPSTKKEITNKIILRNQNKEEIEYIIEKEVQENKVIYILYDSSLYYLTFTFLINNQLYSFYYYKNQLFNNTLSYLNNKPIGFPFNVQQPLGTLEFLFIDHIKTTSKTLSNYQIKLNINHDQSSVFFPNNINFNYILSEQNIFTPVIEKSYIHIIHTSLLSNKNQMVIDNDSSSSYFISKFIKNSLCSTLINKDFSINYLELQHSKSLFLSNGNNLIEYIQYQDLPIYLEKKIYVFLFSNNFDINYCLLEKEWNKHIYNQYTELEEVFKETNNNYNDSINNLNNMSNNIPKNILYLIYIYLFLTKKIHVYSKKTFQKHYLTLKLEYFINSCSLNSFLTSISQFLTIPYYQILQYPSINNLNYQHIFLFIFDFSYLDDIIQDQPNIFYQYLQEISLFLENQEQKQKQQNLPLFICTNYNSSSIYSSQCELFIKNLSTYYSQLFYLTTIKSISTTCLLYDIHHLLQNFKIYNYESLFIIQSFLDEILDNNNNNNNNIKLDSETKLFLQDNCQSYQISLEENTFSLLHQELLFPLSNYQIVLYIKNKYDLVFLIIIWFLKHQHIWNKLENENIIMNINLNKFLKIFSNEKKE